MFLLARDIHKLAQMSATFRYWSDAALGYCCQVDAVGLKLWGGKAHRQNRFSTCWEYLPMQIDLPGLRQG